MSINETNSLEHDPKNWGFCDMKKTACWKDMHIDEHSETYSKDLQETKLRTMSQKLCQILLNNTTFDPLSELCATGTYTLQAQQIVRTNKQWKKGKLEKEIVRALSNYEQNLTSVMTQFPAQKINNAILDYLSR